MLPVLQRPLGTFVDETVAATAALHCVPKSGQPTDADNCVKSAPIFKVLSPLERGVNSKQNPYNICRHTQSMLPRYLWNIKVQICDITNSMFHETKYLLPYGSADKAAVKFTTAARNVRLLPVYTIENAYATRQLHRQ